MIFFISIFLKFSTQCGSHNKVIDVIVFFFLFLHPSINIPVSSFYTVVTFYIEDGFHVLVVVFVVISFIVVSTEI